MKIRPTSLSLLLCLLFTTGACQKIELARTELTQSQWRQVQPYLLEDAPAPKYPLAARFADEVELIGLDIEGALKPGQEVTFSWYWRALKDVSQDWKIFVHLDSQEGRFRQNLDHYPLESLMSQIYRTYHWQEGQIIKDVQTFRLADDAPLGEITPFVGLFRGDRRAPITSADAPADNRASGPALTITGETAQAPHHQLPFIDDAALKTLTIDGRLDEDLWKNIPPIELQPISGDGKYTTEIRAAFSAEGLIMGAIIEDENIWATMDERDQDLWKEEVLEIFFAPKGAHNPYYEFQINPLGTIFDARFERPLSGGASARRAAINQGKHFTIEGLESAVFVDGTINDDEAKDRAWSVELKIPFAGLELSEPPKADAPWLVNIYRMDRPSKDEFHAYAWSTLPNRNFHNVHQFGTWSFAPGHLKSLRTRRLRKMRERLGGTPPSSQPTWQPQPETLRGLSEHIKPPPRKD